MSSPSTHEPVSASNSDKNSDTELIVKREEPLDKVKSGVRWLISTLGAPQDELAAPWVRWLCIWNGLGALEQARGEIIEKMKFPRAGPKDPHTGELKLAAVTIMDRKFAGWFRTFLGIHIISGTIAVQCSWIAIALEKRRPKLAKKLAKIAAYAETFFHAPTALAMSPITYGDPGLVPSGYAVISLLLGLSGASALFESKDEKERADGTFPELRRMACTLAIFHYVRLYALMRGIGGYLRKQKYTAAVITAVAAMLPVGWKRGLFPSIFWLYMVVNGRQVYETATMIQKFGADETMKRQWRTA